MNNQMRSHKILTKASGELEHAAKIRCNRGCIIADIANNLQEVSNRENIGKYSLHKGNRFREEQPSMVDNKEKPREKVTEVLNKRDSCHNFGSTDHSANNLPKEKKKIYSIEQVSKEEVQAEASESDSKGDAIRERSDDNQDPIKEFLVEYQEATHMEIQEIQLDTRLP
ncbi:hypothetical protein O181_061927 [Austropuccinia psidii MF-1]|uniref:Uncharacterized protein n=1 Tax=Austropuccinia psidii MF-1 TaxID=1389203 RepID=A0A9Q3ERD0_9BASI|nr:hypothetical protein [Austropuccinia psidii MF-1]